MTFDLPPCLPACSFGTPNNTSPSLSVLGVLQYGNVTDKPVKLPTTQPDRLAVQQPTETSEDAKLVGGRTYCLSVGEVWEVCSCGLPTCAALAHPNIRIHVSIRRAEYGNVTDKPVNLPHNRTT